MKIDHASLLQTFLAESGENLAAMEEALVVLEVKPDDTETLEEIFRAVHTLKGNAAALGFSGLSEFAHAVEDLLEQVRRQALSLTGEPIDHLLHAIDVLRELVPAAADGNDGLDDTQRATIERLREISRVAPARSGKRTKAPAIGHPAAAPKRSLGGTSWTDRLRTLRVGIDKLDRMLTLTGEIAIARGRIGSLVACEELPDLDAIRQAYWEADRLHMELQELVMQVRMVPLGPTFRQHIRTVRDLAAAGGKQARLVIEGADVEVDTTVIEQIRDPLTHIVRNAVDHGIESPDHRTARGKDPTGRVTLRSYHEAGNVVIQIEDDGAGLNREQIAVRGQSLGLVADLERLSDKELYQLILEPGFSTAGSVTELSGRGVGMDVVRRNVEALRGSVNIETRDGQGTTITIRLPLTLAIIDGFAVGVGAETYVLPLDVVMECLDMPSEVERKPETYGVINLRQKPLPYVRLRHLFDAPRANGQRERLVVVQCGESRAGLVVEVLYGTAQAVIKPLGKVFSNLSVIAGSTILGNGRVALILDVPALLQEAIAAASAGDAAECLEVGAP